jgi:hypothetical protein
MTVIPAKAGIQHAAAYPRHCERSEAIHSSFLCGTMDCFALLAMTAGMVSRSLAAHRAPRFALSSPSLEQRGRREDRVRAAPRSRVQLRTENAHTSIQVQREHPGLLRSGSTAYFEPSPVNGSLATVAPEKLASQELDSSTAASGTHDFTVRFMRARLAPMSRPSALSPDLRPKHNRSRLNKLERFDHLLCSGLVFLEMSCFQMRLVGIHIPIDFKNPDVGRIILFRNRV